MRSCGTRWSHILYCELNAWLEDHSSECGGGERPRGNQNVAKWRRYSILDVPEVTSLYLKALCL